MTQRVLVIDDERDVRQCVESLLSTLPDCHVESAATYTEGCTRALEGWDLIISDFHLPDGDGVDLLDACAREAPETPRVLMSAFQNHPRVLAALRGNTLTDFIRKPFDPEAVLERVSQLLRRAAT